MRQGLFAVDKWDDLALQHLHEAEHYLYVAKVVKLKTA